MVDAETDYWDCMSLLRNDLVHRAFDIYLESFSNSIRRSSLHEYTNRYITEVFTYGGSWGCSCGHWVLARK